MLKRQFLSAVLLLLAGLLIRQKLF